MNIDGIVDRLCIESQRRYANPYTTIEWPDALDEDAWWISPELISIYGTEPYAALSESRKKRLSFHEAVNFFSLNIHGERSLIEGLARRLYRKRTGSLSRYVHHFLDEENKHMTWFGTFCTRYAGSIYRDRKMVFPRDYAEGEEEFLFFAKALLFEELVDVYNRRIAADPRVAPLARQINRLHHLDEVRHLAFGRLVVRQLMESHRSIWSEDIIRGIQQYLAAYIGSMWKEYYNPDVYEDAGLGNGFAMSRLGLDHESCRNHRAEVMQRSTQFLVRHGILNQEAIAS